jgi:hypothetical protein
MVRRGYKSELRAKKELVEKYSSPNVVKIAIGGAQDFLVLDYGKVVKVVEVKEIHHKTYYPSKREQEQFERIEYFAKIHQIPAELWIYRFAGKGKAIIKHTQFIWKPL